MLEELKKISPATGSSCHGYPPWRPPASPCAWGQRDVLRQAIDKDELENKVAEVLGA